MRWPCGGMFCLVLQIELVSSGLMGFAQLLKSSKTRCRVAINRLPEGAKNNDTNRTIRVNVQVEISKACIVACEFSGVTSGGGFLSLRATIGDALCQDDNRTRESACSKVSGVLMPVTAGAAPVPVRALDAAGPGKNVAHAQPRVHPTDRQHEPPQHHCRSTWVRTWCR